MQANEGKLLALGRQLREAGSPAAGTEARRRRQRSRIDRWATRGISVVAHIALAAVALIFLFIAKEALPLFTSTELRAEVHPAELLLPQQWKEGEAPYFAWQPAAKIPKYSLAPLLAGTAKVAAVALATALPLAILAAVFSAEFAPRRLRELIKPAIEILAGIPSVVLGFFTLTVLASSLQSALGLQFRLNAIVAGIGLALSILPLIYTLSEDALLAVPQSVREASLALGASRARTAWSVVLPAASPGVLAACILGLGRAMGETMIVLMASGNAAILSMNPALPTRAIPATIAAEMGEVVVGGAHWSVLFFLASVLFLITLSCNCLGGWVVARLRRHLGERVQ